MRNVSVLAVSPCHEDKLANPGVTKLTTNVFLRRGDSEEILWPTFPFSNLKSFTQFSCLISQVSMFGTMLKRNGKDGHSCLLSNLRGNLLVVQLNMICTVSLELACVVIFAEINSIYTYFLMNFAIQGCYILRNAFCIHGSECIIFSFHSALYYVYWLTLCWNILASQRKMPLDCTLWYFQFVVEFSWLVFWNVFASMFI